MAAPAGPGVWTGRLGASSRPSTILIIDSDETQTAAMAQALSTRGANVFYTAAAHVGRRLSQEHYFDLVVVDHRIDAQTSPRLSDLISRDGHRCVLLSVPQEWDASPAFESSVRGALRRPLEAGRLHQLAADVMRNADLASYRHLLDFEITTR